MSDDEDYNSEEDADYVPSDGELGSEEENSGEEEDLSVLDDNASSITNNKRTRKKKQLKKDLVPRKRKGGIKLEGEEDVPDTNGDAENAELAQKIKEEEATKKEEKEKKRVDDLWSSFLSDVKPQARPPAKVTSSPTAVKQTMTTNNHNSTSSTAASPTTAATKPSSSKITITQVFDFAGEEIKVTKEVDADSKEAKAELKKQEKIEEEKSKREETVSATPPSLNNSIASPSSSSPGSSLLGIKRPAAGGGLSGVLSKIGKKQKMGTLEKSKMDWESFKQKEGINDELKIHNKGKDGYIERMAFLNRTDTRQFEIERDLRLSKSGKR